MKIKTLCEHAGMTRQNYYKSHRRRQRQSVDSSIIVDLVIRERGLQPRLGGRKLYWMLKDELISLGIELGRDHFFEVLRENGLLVDPLPKAPKTTMSAHSLPIFPNLIRNKLPAGPNEIWVSDITYIRLRDTFMYLTLITDAYSRKVVGWHLAESLKTKDALKSLEMALEDLPKGCRPIHHSDRGTQYCSHEYVQRLQHHGLEVSMTEINHCAENALAERMNGILKQEYLLGNGFSDAREAQRCVGQAIELYNHRRPHGSLKMQTPETVHAKAA